MVFWFLFVSSLLILWKSADGFVDASESLAIHLKLPSVIIGATVVAFGTSAPELFVTMFAAADNQVDVVYGSIFGSNMANIFFIFGLALLIIGLQNTEELKKQLVNHAISLSIILGIVVFLQPSLLTSTLALLLFLGINWGMFKQGNRLNDTTPPTEKRTLLKLITLFFICLLLLIASSKCLLYALTNIATLFGFSTAFLSLFAVAFGTSLPELMATIAFAKKGHASIIVGNVFGSNLFNLLLVLPMAWLVAPLPFLSRYFFEILCLFVITIVIAIFSKAFHKYHRAVGVALLVTYATYIGVTYTNVMSRFSLFS